MALCHLRCLCPLAGNLSASPHSPPRKGPNGTRKPWQGQNSRHLTEKLVFSLCQRVPHRNPPVKSYLPHGRQNTAS